MLKNISNPIIITTLLFLSLYPIISYKIEIVAGSNYHLTKVSSSKNGQIFSGETPPGKFIYLNNFRSTFFNNITLTIKAKGGEDFWLGGYVMISYFQMGPMWDFSFQNYCSKMNTFSIEEYGLIAKGCLKDDLLPNYKNLNSDYNVTFSFQIPCPYDIHYLLPKEKVDDWVEFQFGRDYFYVGHGQKIKYYGFDVKTLNMSLNTYNSSVYYPNKQIISTTYQPPQFNSCYDTVIYDSIINPSEKYWLYGAFFYYYDSYHIAYFQDCCPSNSTHMIFIPDNLNWTEAHDERQRIYAETRWWQSHTVKNSAFFFYTEIVYRICQTLCLTCDRYNGCTSCISGYELINGSCVDKSCPNNCEYCANDNNEIVCLHCKKGFSLLEGNFSKCVNDEIFENSIYDGHDYLTGEISDDRKFLYHRLYNLTEHCEKGSYNYCEQCEPDYYLLNNDFSKCVSVNEMKNACCGDFEINKTYSDNFISEYKTLCVDNCKICRMNNKINKEDNSSILITECKSCSINYSHVIEKEGVTQCIQDSLLSSSYYQKEDDSTIYHKPIPIKNCIKYDLNYNCEKCKKNYALYVHKTGQECKISTSHSTSNLNINDLSSNVIYDQPKGYMHNEDYTYYHYCESENCEKIIIYTSKCIEILTPLKPPTYYYETCAKCSDGFGVTKFGCVQLNQLSNYYKISGTSIDGRDYEYYLECGRYCSQCSKGNYCDNCFNGYFRRGLDTERNNSINDCFTDSMKKFFYKLNDDYYPCLPNCESCDGPNYCNECSNGFKSSEDKTQCLCSSIPNCKFCKDQTYCTKCENDYAIVDNNVEKCVSIFQLDDGYYTLDNGETYFSCNITFGNCKFCSSENCHLCREGYDLIFDSETNHTICTHKNNTKTGFYSNGILSKNNETIFFKCMEFCDVCQENDITYLLYDNFNSENEFIGNLSENYQLKLRNLEISCLKCSDNFAFLNHRYYQCFNISNFGIGYIKEDEMNYLTNCTINCKSCEEDSTCFDCFKDYSLIDDFPDECISTIEYLNKGGYYYINKENRFYSCLHGCNECTNKEICKRCFNGYLINEEKTLCDFITDEMRCKYNCNKIPISGLTENNLQNLVRAYSTGYLHDDSSVEIYRDGKIKYMIMIFKNLECSHIIEFNIPCIYNDDFENRNLDESYNFDFYGFNSENLTQKMIEATGQERLIQTFIQIEDKVIYSFYDERTAEKYKVEDYCKSCKSEKINIKKSFINYIVNDKFNQNEIEKILNSEINIFDYKDKFFDDLCISYSINDTDFPLDKRIEYLYQNYSLENLCSEDCILDSINLKEKYVMCSCNFSDSLDNVSKSNKEIKYNIFDIKYTSNILKSFLCKPQNLSKNLGSYIILGFILIQIISFLLLFIIRNNFINVLNPPKQFNTNLEYSEKGSFKSEQSKRGGEVGESECIKLKKNSNIINKSFKNGFCYCYFMRLINYQNIFSIIFIKNKFIIVFRIITIFFIFAFSIVINIVFMDMNYISKKFDYALNSNNKINHWKYAFNHPQIEMILPIISTMILYLLIQIIVFKIVLKNPYKKSPKSKIFILFGVYLIIMICFWFLITSFYNSFKKTFLDILLRAIITYGLTIIFSFIYCMFSIFKF